jgi:hypothetical protein
VTAKDKEDFWKSLGSADGSAVAVPDLDKLSEDEVSKEIDLYTNVYRYESSILHC